MDVVGVGIGIAVGVFVACTLLTVILYCCWRARTEQRLRRRPNESDLRVIHEPSHRAPIVYEQSALMPPVKPGARAASELPPQQPQPPLSGRVAVAAWSPLVSARSIDSLPSVTAYSPVPAEHAVADFGAVSAASAAPSGPIVGFYEAPLGAAGVQAPAATPGPHVSPRSQYDDAQLRVVSHRMAVDEEQQYEDVPNQSAMPIVVPRPAPQETYGDVLRQSQMASRGSPAHARAAPFKGATPKFI